MSKTIKTNKARLARKLNTALLDVINHGERSQMATKYEEIDHLEVNGRRFGNKRKGEAIAKVIARRIERKKANREVGGIDE